MSNLVSRIRQTFYSYLNRSQQEQNLELNPQQEAQQARDRLHKATLDKSEAEQLLENPLIQQVFLEMREEIFRGWAESEPHASDLREIQFRKLQTLDRFIDGLQSKIGAGIIAREQLKQLQEDKE